MVFATIGAFSRVMMWKLGAHERVKMYPLPDTTRSQFLEFVSQTGQLTDIKGFKLEHTETQAPPLYRPLERKLRSFRSISWRSPLRPFESRLRRQRSSIPWHYFTHNPIFKPSIFFSTGFRKFSPNIESDSTLAAKTAMRHRPLYILLRLSTSGRSSIWTLLIGLVEGLVLIVLTSFFAAQWGGNLFVMSGTMIVLLIAITVGRAIGLWSVTLSSKFWGLHVFEMDNTKQVRGCLRLLASTKGVLVEVNKSWWFEGSRLERREGWKAFKVRYDSGDFDADHTLSDRLYDGASDEVVQIGNVTSQSTVVQIKDSSEHDLRRWGESWDRGDGPLRK
jgi:hypothetical protein